MHKRELPKVAPKGTKHQPSCIPPLPATPIAPACRSTTRQPLPILLLLLLLLLLSPPPPPPVVLVLVLLLVVLLPPPPPVVLLVVVVVVVLLLLLLLRVGTTAMSDR